MKNPTTVITHAVLILFFGLFGIGTTPAYAALSHDTSLQWHTLHTQHFRIHYHSDIQAMAKHLSQIAEKVHQELSEKLHWEPQGPTEVVLTDEFDFSNGQADAVPYNQMVIFLTPPAIIAELKDYSDWLETVFTHEYVHVLHLDKAHQGPYFLRHIFGRMPLLFPNRYQPGWLIEGLATYYETNDERGTGRGQSSYFNMLMRMEVAQGIKPVHQVNQVFDSWPDGIVPYLYGVHFYRFLKASRGEQAIGRMVDGYSGLLLPFFINTNAKSTLGKNFTQLWQEYGGYLKNQFQPQLDQVAAQGIHTGSRISHENYRRLVLKNSADRVYALAESGDAKAKLFRLGDKHAVTIHDGSHFDIHPRAGIILAQPDIHKNSQIFFDLYRLDNDLTHKKRLTKGKRYILACWRYDGEAIIAVQTVLGRSRLLLLGKNGELESVFWDGAYGEAIAELSCSPREDKIVVAMFRPGSGWNLEMFNVASSSWQMLTRDKGIEEQPRFIDDGKQVLFSADYDGIYNIYRMNLSDKSIQMHTRVQGGAFSPVDANAHILFSAYDGKGFDIFQLDDHRALTDAIKIIAGPSAEPHGKWPVTHSEKTAYRGWTKLVPNWWFPYFAGSENQNIYGLTTSAYDPLGQQSYDVFAGYDARNDVINAGISYVNDQFFPTWILNASRAHEYIEDNQTLLAIDQTDKWQVSALLPLLSFDRSWSLQPAALSVHSESVYANNVSNRLAPFDDGIAALGINYDSTDRHPLSVSRSDGRSIMLTAESHDLLPSDFQGLTYSANWREFIPLGGENVLALQLNGGLADDDARFFRLGGVNAAPPSGALVGLALNQRFYRREYPLRGYDNSLPQLFGNRMMSASMEWRFLLHRPEWGFMVPPVSLQTLSASLFVDSGDAWTEGDSFDPLTGVGVELNFDTRLFYIFPIYIRVGYASGLATLGGEQVYMSLGASF